MNKVILYVATSKDGFIADENGGVDWLPPPSDTAENPDEFGFATLLASVKTIVMGSKSYEQILTFGDWAWNDKITYVFTTRSFANDNPNINFINGRVDELINKLNQNSVSQNIWLLGGANLIAQFAENNLIDECIITEVPTTLGAGIKMNLAYEDFELLNIKKCSQDILQKHYANKKLNSRC